MKTIHIEASEPYNVLIGSGILDKSGEIVSGLLKSKHTVIVSDDNVYPLYGKRLEKSLIENGFSVDSFVFPHGEESKSHKTLIELYNFLAEKNITRSDSLIALGGGVTGDLTGFAAASFLRGIDYVQIPTSLLAQIDSSVGGKTAVDIAGGKNLVGAFKQPKVVIADIDTLSTLSEDFFADGMGEAVKYGMIYSRELFDLIKSGKIKENLQKIIETCVDIKRKVVENDEFDLGLRMILNFGHTLGHSIEKYYNYNGISHGKAVATGMFIMTLAAEEKGIIEKNISDELKECLIVNNLPYETEVPDKELFNGAINDKKRFSDNINLIICKEIGKAEIVKMPVSDFEKLICN